MRDAARELAEVLQPLGLLQLGLLARLAMVSLKPVGSLLFLELVLCVWAAARSALTRSSNRSRVCRASARSAAACFSNWCRASRASAASAATRCSNRPWASSDDLRRGVAVEPLGVRVPAVEDGLPRHADDRVMRRLDHKCGKAVVRSRCVPHRRCPLTRLSLSRGAWLTSPPVTAASLRGMACGSQHPPIRPGPRHEETGQVCCRTRS